MVLHCACLSWPWQSTCSFRQLMHSFPPLGLQDAMKSGEEEQIALQTVTGNRDGEEVLEAETPSFSLKLLSSSTCLPPFSQSNETLPLGIQLKWPSSKKEEILFTGQVGPCWFLKRDVQHSHNEKLANGFMEKATTWLLCYNQSWRGSLRGSF